MSTSALPLRTRVPRLAEAAVARARLTVVPRRRTQPAPRVPFVTLVTLLLLGGVIGLLLFNTSMQQSAFAASQLDEQATNLGDREQTLQLELERLRDPQRVAKRAEAMGMVRSTSPAFLDLRTDRVLGEATVATGQDGMRVRPYPMQKPRALTPPVTVVHETAPPQQAGQQHTGQQNTGQKGAQQQTGQQKSGDTGTGSANRGSSTGRNVG
jgi:hypothetical protein